MIHIFFYFASFVWFGCAMFGILHQAIILKMPFEISQLGDTTLHHEHLILICIINTIVSWICGNVLRDMKNDETKQKLLRETF